MYETGPLIKLIARFAISQPGAFWVGILLIVAIAWNFDKFKSKQNISLLILMLPAIPLIDSLLWVTRVEGSGHTDTQAKMLLDFAFGSLYAVTAFIAAWAFTMSRGKNVINWHPNLPENALKVIVVIVILMNISATLGRLPDDAGWFSNLGAQRWLETGVMPYADPLLKGPDSPAHGAAATYGPLLLLAHIPFQFLTGGGAINPADMNPLADNYKWPPMLATQLTCLFFHFLGLWALYGIGKKLGNKSLGLTLVILYAGSTYVLGIGSVVIPSYRPDPEMAGGLVFISHIAPNAMMLMALYYLEKPFLSGIFMAIAAGILFFPIFFLPLFVGWLFWREKRSAAQFLAGLFLAGSLIGLLVVIFTGTVDGKGPIKLLLESTLEHQEGFSSDQYGMSPYSFWGNFPTLASFWQKPLIGTTSIFKPTFILFITFCLSTFFFSKKRTIAEFALMLAALTAAIQLWKTHAAGSYVEWYYPFLLIGLLSRSSHWKKNTPITQGQE